MAQQLNRVYPSKPQRVYFYATCIVDTIDPQSGLDAMSLLEREGMEVIWVEKQTCCGQPAYTSGYPEQAQSVASSQMALFPEDIPIVVMSGSCAGMMFHHYPSLFERDSEEQLKAQRFSQRVFELTEFMVKVCRSELSDQGQQCKVTLHTSCSGRREMGIHLTSEALLQQLESVQLRRAEYEHECCGFGGAFSVRHPEISQAMVEDKAEHLLAAEAEFLVSADWGCMLNINGHLKYRQGEGAPQMIHLASFLWQRTQAEKR